MKTTLWDSRFERFLVTYPVWQYLAACEHPDVLLGDGSPVRWSVLK